MSLDEIKATLKEMLVERLSLKLAPAEIQDEAPLFKSSNPDVPVGLDLDSVEALEIVVGIEERFGVTVEEGSYEKQFYSIDTVAQFVAKLLSEKTAA
jgi:acyl carrier protein